MLTKSGLANNGLPNAAISITPARIASEAELGVKPIAAFVLFYTKGCDRFVEYCGQMSDVVELHRISGHQYNFLVKLVTESLQTLERAINELGAFGDSTTLIVLSSPIKQKPLVP